MIKEKELMSKPYQFKHVELKSLEKDEQGNVLVFSAEFVSATLPNQVMSDGHIEINQTLWNQQSEKRPPGYWLLGSPEREGVTKSIFASEEWMEQTPKEEAMEKRQLWNVG